jgi:hypothetical protein
MSLISKAFEPDNIFDRDSRQNHRAAQRMCDANFVKNIWISSRAVRNDHAGRVYGLPNIGHDVMRAEEIICSLGHEISRSECDRHRSVAAPQRRTSERTRQAAHPPGLAFRSKAASSALILRIRQLAWRRPRGRVGKPPRLLEAPFWISAEPSVSNTG